MFYVASGLAIISIIVSRLYINEIKSEQLKYAVWTVFNGLVAIVVLLIYIAIKIGGIL